MNNAKVKQEWPQFSRAGLSFDDRHRIGVADKARRAPMVHNLGDDMLCT
ncbi:hypothetical protein ACILG0_21355 [Pseudomonadota bacterium AL_CKDN230030165-1A_HGKHYDSX7]